MEHTVLVIVSFQIHLEKLGGLAHQNTISNIVSDLIERGYKVIKEYRVKTLVVQKTPAI